MTRTVTALFEEQARAERTCEALAEMGVPRARIALHRAEGGQAPSATPDAPGGEAWLPGLLDALFLSEEDLAPHREAVRRGMTLLTATVPDELAAQVSQALEAEGAADFDAHEASWRAGGWSPAAMAGAVREDGSASSMALMPGTGGMDAEGARMALSGTIGTNTTGASAPDAGGQRRDPRLLARREPGIGRARSYVIEAPLAEEPQPANDALRGATSVA